MTSELPLGADWQDALPGRRRGAEISTFIQTDNRSIKSSFVHSGTVAHSQMFTAKALTSL
jgi:hypothetical protein